MPLVVVAGGFFGDEGKGKIAAYLGITYRPSIAVRTGSINAGHTVVYNGKVWKLRTLPSAFLYEKSLLMVPAGALIRRDVFFRELSETGVGPSRVVVDRNAGVITEEHVKAERCDPLLRDKVGSTVQGVGAATAERVLRRLKLASEYPELKSFIGDVSSRVLEALESGERVLVEGTQGFHLSLYHGTYPYVTSRDTSVSGILSEVGVGPKDVDDVILVFKSYVTRVGGGPLPGELKPEDAERLGWVERGTVTGRLRRVAPFNLELARRAVRANSATQIAITKIDALFREASNVREWGKLPRQARSWIEGLEEELKVPVTLIGTGSDVLAVVDRRKDLGFEC